MEKRLRNQRDQMLALLKFMGNQGVTNHDLNDIGRRYTARIMELRKHYEIETKQIDKATFVYIYKGPIDRRVKNQPLPFETTV